MLVASSIKVPIWDRESYEEAIEFYAALGRSHRVSVWGKNFALSIIMNKKKKPVLEPNVVLHWLKQDKLPDILLNVQIHKFIGVQ